MQYEVNNITKPIKIHDSTEFRYLSRRDEMYLVLIIILTFFWLFSIFIILPIIVPFFSINPAELLDLIMNIIAAATLPIWMFQWLYSRHKSRIQLEQKQKELDLHIENVLNQVMITIEEVLLKSESLKSEWFRSDGLKWIDFEEGCFVPRSISDLKHQLDESKLLLLLAKSGAGKTSFVYHLGFTLKSKITNYKYVYYENLGRPSSRIQAGIDESSIVYTPLIRILRHIQDSMKQHSRYRNQRALVILDDVHLMDYYVDDLLTIIEEVKDNVSVLISARMLYRTFGEERKHWEEIINPQKKVGKHEFLEFSKKNYRNMAAQIIAEYLNAKDVPKEEFQKIIEDCDESLFILCLVLKQISTRLSEEKNLLDILRTITPIDGVKGYYNELRTKIPEESLEDPKSFFDVLVSLATFHQMEIGVPSGILTNLSNHSKQDVKRVIEFLKRNREVIVYGVAGKRVYYLPHLSVARLLMIWNFEEYPSRRYQEEEGLEELEKKAIALIDYCLEYDIDIPIFRFNLFSRKYGLQPTKYYDHFRGIGAKKLSKLFLRQGMRGVAFLPSEVKQDSSVIQEISQLIENSDDPSQILIEISMVEEWREEPEIEQSIERMIPRITKQIEKSKEPASILRGILQFPVITKNHKIKSTIIQTLQKAENPCSLIWALQYSEEIRTDDEIQAAVLSDDTMLRIGKEVLASNNPIGEINAIWYFPNLTEQDRIKEVTNTAIERISENIRISEDANNYLMSLVEMYDVRDDSRITDAIAEFIPKSPDILITLWFISLVPCWANNAKIGESLDYLSIAYDAFLKNLSEPSTLLLHMLKVPILRENDAIKATANSDEVIRRLTQELLPFTNAKAIVNQLKALIYENNRKEIEREIDFYRKGRTDS